MSNPVNTAPVIDCKQIKKTFTDGTSTPVLKGIDLSLAQGESLAVVGASGSGKSTLLQIMGGLDTATSGEVRIMGQSIHNLSEKALGQLRNQHLGFVYQFHHLLGEFSALENVCMPLLIGGASPSQAKDKASAMLEQVGLSHRLDHKPSKLSGGERQRAAIARALVSNPSCVLADEPTGNLDSNTAQSVFDLMMDLKQQLNTSFVVVTHDLSLADKMDRCVTLKDGVMV